MKEILKRIKVFTESGILEATDLDNTSLDEYSKQLSNLLYSPNVSILVTSSGCLILKPSRIIGFSVTEEKRVREQKKGEPPKRAISESEDRLVEEQ
jgi:hypothetical protein